MTTLYKHSFANFYEVVLEEIRSIDKVGYEFSSVLMRKYLRRGDHWIFVDQYLYSEWSMESVVKLYIEELNYCKGE